MPRKKKQKLSREEIIEIYKEYIPVIRPDKIMDWKVDQNGKVVLSIENKGKMNWIAQKLFKKPRISYVHLDETGSFIWQMMDGNNNIEKIAYALKRQFGKKAEPLWNRLLKYCEILESYDFVSYRKPDPDQE